MEILAIDVGGTKVDMGIVKDGKLIARDRFLTAQRKHCQFDFILYQR